MALSGNFNTTKYYTNSNGSIGLNLSWTGTQSVSDNSTTINWTLKSNGTMSSGYYVQGGPITVTIGGITVLNQTGRFKVNGSGAYKKTGTVVIPHGDDGTKSVTMSVRAALYSASVNCTGSYTYTLDPISRYAYVTSAPNFDDEANPTMNYANPLGDALSSTQACISIDGENQDIAYRDIDIDGSSYTFELTESERDILRAACPDSNTLNVYFMIKSIMGDDTYYSKKTAVMSIVNGNPVISNAEYYDTNPETIAVTHDATKIIQALSSVEFKFGSLTALKHATLVSASITINGVTETIPLSESVHTDVIKAIGELNLSSSLPAILDVVDSRGLHTTEELTINIYGWSIPTCSISLNRINNFYTESNLRVQSSYSSIDGQNSVVITYQSKHVTDEEYGPEIQVPDNATTVIALDNRYEWNVRVKVRDLVGGSTTYNLSVGKGIPIIFFDRLKKSMGINCFPGGNECLEIDGNLSVSGSINLPYVDTEVISECVTKKSGSFNITKAHFKKWGNVCQLYVAVTTTASIAAGANLDMNIGSVLSNYMPEYNVYSVEYDAQRLIGAVLSPENNFVRIRNSNTQVGSGVKIEEVFTWIL